MNEILVPFGLKKIVIDKDNIIYCADGKIDNDQIKISLRSVTGEKENGWEPFGPDDNWWYGETKGDCNWIGGYNETDAAKKIQKAIMNNKPLVAPPRGYCFTYSNKLLKCSDIWF